MNIEECAELIQTEAEELAERLPEGAGTGVQAFITPVEGA